MELVKRANFYGRNPPYYSFVSPDGQKMFHFENFLMSAIFVFDFVAVTKAKENFNHKSIIYPNTKR